MSFWAEATWWRARIFMISGQSLMAPWFFFFPFLFLSINDSQIHIMRALYDDDEKERQRLSSRSKIDFFLLFPNEIWRVIICKKKKKIKSRGPNGPLVTDQQCPPGGTQNVCFYQRRSAQRENHQRTWPTLIYLLPGNNMRVEAAGNRNRHKSAQAAVMPLLREEENKKFPLADAYERHL